MIDQILKITAIAVFLAILVGRGSLRAEESEEQTPTESPESDALASERLEADNARIGSITIITNNIFDLENPLEDRLLYRYEQHIRSRKPVGRSPVVSAGE